MNEMWAPKIYTPAGFVKENIFAELKVLDVGCGRRKLPGATGIDIVRDSQADVIHDINQAPWPFSPDNFDIIFMNHVLEHTDNVLKTLNEAYRVAKSGGRIIIQVPYFRSTDAYVDPTHKHFFTSHSLDYFFEGAGFSDYKYVSFRFRKLGFWYGWPHRSRNPLRQLIKTLVHKYPDFYDQYLSLLLPVECVTWELEALK